MAGGAASLVVTVPPTPALVGTTLNYQATDFANFAVSNALEVHVGL